LGATSRSGIYGVGRTQSSLGQGPLTAPSVFNFFSPNFQLPGAIHAAGLYSPEFQLQTETQGVLIVDALARRVALDASTTDDNAPVLDLSGLAELAADPESLLDDLDVLLLGGEMSATLRQQLRTAIDLTPDTGDEASRLQRARNALTFLVVSPEYAVQR
jgi:hypothetical protein